MQFRDLVSRPGEVGEILRRPTRPGQERHSHHPEAERAERGRERPAGRQKAAWLADDVVLHWTAPLRSLPAPNARVAEELAPGLGHEHGFLAIADMAMALDRALHAQHHPRAQDRVVVRNQPRRIPAEPDPVAETREIALRGEAEISQTLESR